VHFIQKLEKLDLGGNQIGDQGAEDLANALNNNKVNCILYSSLSLPYVLSHRHSKNFALAGISSETMEENS
jgi:Ran GTPase-activating protein (RanGAP) involved in mRNA processing and transport